MKTIFQFNILLKSSLLMCCFFRVLFAAAMKNLFTTPKITLITLMCYLSINSFAQTIRTVGNTGANYATLKLAFDAINNGTINGDIILQVIANTTEPTFGASLNASGSGNSSYTSVLIYPTAPGLKISGNINSSIINLNGADNVTIDGRVNLTGADKDLTIENTSCGLGGSRVLTFGFHAENNIIEYCVIKGCNSSAISGVIHFDRFFTTPGNGNSNNTISNNDFTGTTTGRPVNAIYSHGSSTDTIFNENNTISNNNFYNHHLLTPPHGTSHAIQLRSRSSFTISGNSFYETSDFTFANNCEINPIYASTIGTVNISGNYFGGQAPQCGGGKLTLNDNGTERSLSYTAISLHTTGSINQSHLTDNTISNIEIKRTTSTNPFRGLWAFGFSHLGNVNGNTIGAASGTDAIMINTNSSSTDLQNIFGFQIELPTGAAQTHNIKDNIIGSIGISSTNSANRPNFRGIQINGGLAGTNVFIENNLIGSLTTANSINNSNVHAGSGQSVVGIETFFMWNNGPLINYYIRNNTIANINNNTIGTSFNDRLCGITCSGGNSNSLNYEISGNVIRNLSCASNNVFTRERAALIGILQSSGQGTSMQNIFNNTIHDLVSTSNNLNAAINVTGIYFEGPTAASTSNIHNNFIHSLRNSSSNTSTTAYIHGIEIDNSSTAGSGIAVIRNIYNNVISLGTDVSSTANIRNIIETNSAVRTNNIYFNTLYMGGIASGHANAEGSIACLWSGSSGTNTVKNIRNNIMVNARTASGASNDFFCITLGGDLGATSINYNNYMFSGTGGALARMNTDPSGSFSTIAAWQTELNSRAGVSGKDANSLDIDPDFANTGGTLATDYKPISPSIPLDGIQIPGIDRDFEAILRNSTPQMGAFENTLPFCINPSNAGVIETSQTICSFDNPAPFTSASGASGHSGILEYKWQYSLSPDFSSDINEIVSSNSETYHETFNLTTSHYYRRLAKVACQSDWTNAVSSNIIEVKVNPIPIISISPNENLFLCTGAVNLSASAGLSNYSWSNGESGQTITINSPGEVYVSAQNSENCIGQSEPITINPAYEIQVDIAAPHSSICEGDQVTITTLQTYSFYQWSNGENGNSITINQAGNYYLTANDSNGCEGISENIEINITENPVAVFAFNQSDGYTIDFTNLSSSANSYFWNFGGGNTSTQENPSFTYPFDGFYPVTLIVSSECGSDTIIVTIEVLKLSSALNPETSKWTIAPNPFIDFLIIQPSLTVNENVSIHILNVLGQEVYSTIYPAGNQSPLNINFSHFNKGIYFVKLASKNEYASYKIVKK
jgi:PKD repeat protein